MPQVSVRPEGAFDRSSSFILSIDAKWMPALCDGSLTCLIRKRLPFAGEVSEVYFHAKSPVSSIFGRAKVVGIEKIPVASAVARNGELQMNEKEIKAYTKGLSEIGFMKFCHFEATSDPVGMQNLREMVGYYPPQSFAFISRAALPLINDLCGF